MIAEGKLVKTGVKVSAAWSGKHQGYVHVRDGVYWESMYMPTAEERRVQMALLDKRYPDTRKRLLDVQFKIGTMLT